MTEFTEEEKEKLRDLIESWDNVRVGVRAISILGNTIKWVAGIAVAITAILTFKDFK